MNKFDKKLRQMAAEEKIEMPDQVKKKMEATFLTLPPKETKHKQFAVMPRMAFAAACLAFMLIFVMPNVSVVYAESMEKIPLLGDLIHVVTIRNYFYSDRTHEMDIDVPSVSNGSDGNAADRINDDVDELTQELMKQFYDELEIFGSKGHGSVYVDYDVQTNTPRWFTLKLSVNMVAASGSRYYKYYHIDRNTGEITKLSDLFKTEDYNRILTENIKAQMHQRMQEDSSQTYFMKNAGFGFEFADVSGDHNFYFNDDGDLVIPFDKYEVAPGSMGCPEFTIDIDEIRDIMKDEYQNINSFK